VTNAGSLNKNGFVSRKGEQSNKVSLDPSRLSKNSFNKSQERFGSREN
jgi:hypothetical protein